MQKRLKTSDSLLRFLTNHLFDTFFTILLKNELNVFITYLILKGEVFRLERQSSLYIERLGEHLRERPGQRPESAQEKTCTTSTTRISSRTRTSGATNTTGTASTSKTSSTSNTTSH